MIVYYRERAMAECVGRLPKAGASEELKVLGVEQDADVQQVQLRALIARGTSHRNEPSNEAVFIARAPENSS